MAQKNFKVGEAIQVKYQAAGSESGITINMEVYDETNTLVPGGPTILTEIANSGRYYGDFIPDEIGDWSVQIEKSDGTGKMTKAFSVGSWNVHELGAKITITDGKVDDQNTNLGVVHTKVDELKTDGTARDTLISDIKTKTDKLTDMESNIDVIVGDLDEIKSPPMLG